MEIVIENDLKCSARRQKRTMALRSFWKDVRLMNNCRTPLPCSIDGVSGDANIAGIWKEHFEQLFNCVNDVGDVTFSTEYSSDIAVSAAEVEQAVMRLRHKKACGLDGIYQSMVHTWRMYIPSNTSAAPSQMTAEWTKNSIAESNVQLLLSDDYGIDSGPRMTFLTRQR